MLYPKYGKGIYIYNAYAFYRELPEGVAGAYRIFANMISLAKNPDCWCSASQPRFGTLVIVILPLHL